MEKKGLIGMLTVLAFIILAGLAYLGYNSLMNSIDEEGVKGTYEEIKDQVEEIKEEQTIECFIEPINECWQIKTRETSDCSNIGSPELGGKVCDEGLLVGTCEGSNIGDITSYSFELEVNSEIRDSFKASCESNLQGTFDY